MRKIVLFYNAVHWGTNCGVYCWYNYNAHWDFRRNEKDLMRLLCYCIVEWKIFRVITIQNKMRNEKKNSNPITDKK